MKTKWMKVGGAFITFFIAASLSAQAPQLLNYQGKLNNKDGTAVAGSLTIVFSIYATNSGGTALWTETQQNVPVTNGVFNVLLGSINPLVNRLTNKGLFAEAGERYLGIKVGADPEMAPRFQLTSVSYAIKSSQADKATTADTARVAQMALAGGRIIDGNSLDAADGDPKDVVFVDNNGNVGIGTTNPTAKLEVNGNMLLGDGISIKGDIHAQGNIFGNGNIHTGVENNRGFWMDSTLSYRYGIWRDRGNNVHLRAGDLSNRITIDHITGNVGIGMTIPAFRLDILNPALGQALDNAVDWFRVAGFSSNNDQLRIFHRRHTNGTNWQSAEIKIQKRVDVADHHYISFKGNAGTSNLEFGYGNKPQMTVLENGNVGIGTTNPIDKLHISQGAIKIGSSGSISQNWWEFGLDDGTTSTGIDFHGGSILTDYTARIQRIAGDNSEFQLVNNGTGPMNFYTNNTAPPKMTIIANGNVGIGTTNPQSKLEVNGDIMLNRGTADGARLIWTGGVNEYRARVDPVGELHFFPKEGIAATLVLTQSRKVGVGIGNPAASLHALGNATDPIGYFESTGTQSYIRFATSEGLSNRVEISNRAGGILSMWTAGAGFAFNLTRDGKVGIGTDSPQYNLHVNGSVAGVGAYTALSDLRYKKNIAPIPNAIDKVTRLRGVSFDWRQEEFPELNFNKDRNLGFIAQEIKEILPEVVSQDSKGYYSVAYSNVVPVLVEAIKEQQQTIAQLQAQVQKNEAALAGFKEKMSRIEAALQKLNEKTDRSLAATGQ